MRRFENLAPTLVLMGEAPGKHPGHDPDRHALFPYPPLCSGARLCDMIGLGMSKYIGLDRRNLFREYPGAAGKGSRFPPSLARARAAEVAPELAGRKVLLVGWRVAQAFGLEGAKILTWHAAESGGFDHAIVPHPSGINRWWNESDNRIAGEKFLRELGALVEAGGFANPGARP